MAQARVGLLGRSARRRHLAFFRPKCDIAEELDTLDLLARLEGVDEPFRPSLVGKGFLEGKTEFGLAERDLHGTKGLERYLVDLLALLWSCLLLDFGLKGCQFLTQAGHDGFRVGSR